MPTAARSWRSPPATTRPTRSCSARSRWAPTAASGSTSRRRIRCQPLGRWRPCCRASRPTWCCAASSPPISPMAPSARPWPGCSGCRSSASPCRSSARATGCWWPASSEGGLHEQVAVRLPAVVSVQTGINSPRYVNFRQLKQAEATEIDVRTAADEPGATGLADGRAGAGRGRGDAARSGGRGGRAHRRARSGSGGHERAGDRRAPPRRAARHHGRARRRRRRPRRRTGRRRRAGRRARARWPTPACWRAWTR